MKTMATTDLNVPLPGEAAVFSTDGQRLPVLWSLGSPSRLLEVKNDGLYLIITLRDMWALILSGTNVGTCHIKRLRRCCVAAQEPKVEPKHDAESCAP